MLGSFGPAPVLSASLLERLAALWHASGAPIVEELRQGLSYTEIDRSTASLNLSLPQEARVWWGWHDGGVGDNGPSQIGPHFWYFSLEEAIGLYREQLSAASTLAADSEAHDADHWWAPSWFPLTDSGGQIAFDCSVPAHMPTPIRRVNPHDVNGFRDPKARSLGELVTWWIEAIEHGFWEFDKT